MKKGSFILFLSLFFYILFLFLLASNHMHAEARRALVINVLIRDVAAELVLTRHQLAWAWHIGSLLPSTERIDCADAEALWPTGRDADKESICVSLEFSGFATLPGSPPVHRLLLRCKPLRPNGIKVVLIRLHSLGGCDSTCGCSRAADGEAAAVVNAQRAARLDDVGHHLLNLAGDRDVLLCREVAPEGDVLVNNLHLGKDVSGLALLIAACTPQKALKVGVWLTGAAVVQDTDMLVFQRLGSVEHVLQDNERRHLWLEPQNLVDVGHRGSRTLVSHR